MPTQQQIRKRKAVQAPRAGLRGVEKRKEVVILSFKRWAKTARLAPTAVREVVEVLLKNLALEPPTREDRSESAFPMVGTELLVAGLVKRSLRR